MAKDPPKPPKETKDPKDTKDAKTTIQETYPMAQLVQLRDGSVLISDGTIPCLPVGTVVTVHIDHDNPDQDHLRIMCNKGSHRLNYTILTGLYMITQ